MGEGEGGEGMRGRVEGGSLRVMRMFVRVGMWVRDHWDLEFPENFRLVVVEAFRCRRLVERGAPGWALGWMILLTWIG